MFAGIDFGTSNSSIGLFQGDALQLFPLDPDNLNPHVLPSMIYISRDLEVAVGTYAIRSYLEQETGRRPVWAKQDLGKITITVAGGKNPIIYDQPVSVDVDIAPKGRLLQSIKTALRSADYEGTQVFERYYAVEELIAILLTQLRLQCEDGTGQPVERAVIGRPVKFSEDPQIDARAQQKLSEAARLAGFKEVFFEYEPVGGAYLYHQTQVEHQNVLIFDFGGGTLDMTVMEVGGKCQPQAIASEGVLLGGDDLTARIMKKLLPYFGEGALLADGRPVPAHIFDMLYSWQNMVELSRPHYTSIITQAKKGNNPSGAQRLETLVNKKLGFSLFQELERVKVGLSAAYLMPIKLNKEDLHLSEIILRTQFERLIQDELSLVENTIDELLRKSGLKAEQIHAVLRTGGSAEIPAFIDLLANRFGTDRIKEINPFTTIVGGLALKGYELSQSS